MTNDPPRPQWLTDAFALTHPAALDPDQWREAKRREALWLAGAKHTRRGGYEVELAVAARLSRLPDVLVYDRMLRPGPLFPYIIVKMEAFNVRADRLTQTYTSEVSISLTYVTKHSYFDSAMTFLDLTGSVARTLLDKDADDDLAKLTAGSRLDSGRAFDVRRHNGEEWVTATLRYDAIVKDRSC